MMDFGCFVELDGVRGKVREGLVHVGQVRFVRLPACLPVWGVVWCGVVWCGGV